MLVGQTAKRTIVRARVAADVGGLAHRA